MAQDSEINPVVRNLHLLVGGATAATVAFFVQTLGWAGVGMVWLLIAVVVATIYWGRRERGRPKGVPRAKIRVLREPFRPVCDPGPHLIEGGGLLPLPLDVDVGERISGRLEEEDGEDFDWYIMDERNLVAFRNADWFEYAIGNDHVAADIVDWLVEEEGPWFLVLSLYRRLNDRIIEVSLRRLS
ncbi:MAG: hypothetical protein ACE5KH_04410 [Candidatus Geothermarchaeales archaeon]